MSFLLCNQPTRGNPGAIRPEPAAGCPVLGNERPVLNSLRAMLLRHAAREWLPPDGVVAVVPPMETVDQISRPFATTCGLNCRSVPYHGRSTHFFASSGKSVGDIERHRVVSMRNCRNFLQVESKDLC